MPAWFVDLTTWLFGFGVGFILTGVLIVLIRRP